MSVAPLPKSWLIHDITYEAYLGRDAWGNDTFENPIEINFVRYDDGSVFSRTIQEDTVRFTGVIFIDAKNSMYGPTQLKEKSRITYEGRQLKVQKVINCFQPDSKKIHHYELEVL